MEWHNQQYTPNVFINPEKGSRCRMNLEKLTLGGSVDCYNYCQFLLAQKGFYNLGFGKAGCDISVVWFLEY